MSSIRIGETLAHYEILSKIGEGGMGEVYRATDTKLGRDVALKVLPAEMASNRERLERFQREAKALAALDNPGIVTVYSVEEADGIHFLTMQLVEGQSLDRLIPKDGLPIDQLLKIARALAGALAAAHEKGIIHRDLKPANIMLNANGRLKVLDFGLAKLTAAENGAPPDRSTAMKTREGVVMGTVPYMSPEQVSGRGVDHRTDIFSVGVILYEMATGQRPFQADSSAELMSSILRDTPRPLDELRADLPDELAQLIDRCLEKSAADRVPSTRTLRELLGDVTRSSSPVETVVRAASRPSAAADSSAARTDEGFWVAVLPFKYKGANTDLTALAEGLSEEIVTGLSRFSYLRVIARSSTERYAAEVVDARDVGKEIGARYVMEGSLRQAGSMLRVAVQLVDASTGAHLWSETYDRTFSPDAVFELQDELVPRVVSTVADMHGILPRGMSEIVRLKAADQLTPYEALLHSFGYNERFNPEALAEARTCLERAVEQSPENADCLAMLSVMYSNEFGHWDVRNPDYFEKALQAARKAVKAAPLNSLPHYALAQALYFRREFAAARTAAERAVSLNPMDATTSAFMGLLIAYSGDWERGCALAERGLELNPNLPGMYNYPAWHDAYRRKDYRRALDLALKLNTPESFYQHAVLAMCYAQLGQMDDAHKSLQDMLALKPDYGKVARQLHGKWIQPDLVEQLMEGLIKAGLDVEREAPAAGTTPTPGAESAEIPSIAVLPFANMSADQENQYFSDGLAEEIINALTRLPGLRVIARTSAFRFRGEQNLRKVGEALGVRTLLEGSVRKSDQRVRITAQLIDVADDSHIWSERFDRELVDVFAIQDEISAAIVEKLHLSLGAEEPVNRERANVAAFEALVEGRHFFFQFTPGGAERALACIQRALSLEPDYPDALALHAFYHVMLAYMFADPREALPQASRLAERALAVDPHHGEALSATALAAVWMERDWAEGERLFQRALALAPASAQNHELYGLISLLGKGRLTEALAELDRAIELDPLSALYAGNRGRVLTCSRRFAEAEESCRRGLALDPGQLLVQVELIYALTFQRRFEEAAAIGRRAIEVHGHANAPLNALALSLALAGEHDEARQLLDDAAAPVSGTYRSPLTQGLVHAACSERDAAFECVHRAIDKRDPLLIYLSVHPMFDTLRDDHRYPDLLKRMNLLEG